MASDGVVMGTIGLGWPPLVSPLMKDDYPLMKDDYPLMKDDYPLLTPLMEDDYPLMITL